MLADGADDEAIVRGGCKVKEGLIKGMLAGALLGASAATAFGVMNWEKERQWKNQAMRMGKTALNTAERMMHR